MLIDQGKEASTHMKHWKTATRQKLDVVKAQWAHFDTLRDYILIKDMGKMLFLFCEAIVFILRKHNVPRAVSAEIVVAAEKAFGLTSTVPSA